MGGLSPWHLIIIAVVLLVMFGGRGKLSSLMGDAAKGIKAFRDGMKDEHETPPAQPAASLPPAPAGKRPDRSLSAAFSAGAQRGASAPARLLSEPRAHVS